jgi:hypothetical protein
VREPIRGAFLWLLAAALVIAACIVVYSVIFKKPVEVLSIDCQLGRRPHPDQILVVDSASLDAWARGNLEGPFGADARHDDARLGDRSVATCRVANRGRLTLTNVVVTFDYRGGSLASPGTSLGSSIFPVVIFRMLPANGGSVNLRFDNATKSLVNLAPAAGCAVQLPAEEKRRACKAHVRIAGANAVATSISLSPGV